MIISLVPRYADQPQVALNHAYCYHVRYIMPSPGPIDRHNAAEKGVPSGVAARPSCAQAVFQPTCVVQQTAEEIPRDHQELNIRRFAKEVGGAGNKHVHTHTHTF